MMSSKHNLSADTVYMYGTSPGGAELSISHVLHCLSVICSRLFVS